MKMTVSVQYGNFGPSRTKGNLIAQAPRIAGVRLRVDRSAPTVLARSGYQGW